MTMDDPDDDAGGSGPPLPPDDRLWRHPSEMGALAPAPPTATAPTRRSRGSSPWPVAVTAALVGAALASSVLAATGTFGRTTVEPAVEKVAVTPVVSSPMLPGDRGVPALAERVSPSIVRVVVHGSDDTAKVVSGVVFRTDGLVLTSANELAGSRSIAVVLHDGERHEAEVVGTDLATDVAVVRIDATGLPVAVLGSSGSLQVGTPAVAFGCPQGEGEAPRLTTGVVSALDRRVVAHGVALHGMIQTDAPIEAAAAGGPLVDAHGAVVGITTAVTGAQGAGFGYATPIDLVARVAEQLVHSGQAVHSWLGVEGADLSMAEADALGLPGGALVNQVAAGSPAASGGLHSGDVIVGVEGTEVASSSDLVVLVREHRPGDTITVTYHRAGRPREASVTLSQRPGG
ncbi:MAG: S1C family serine protease [Acidimicrobiales bacterium]